MTIRNPKLPCVYIMASQRNGTLYVGVTSDLVGRVWKHRDGTYDGFTKRYRVHLLVWYETHHDMRGAIARETQIKRWNRDWKLALIEKTNPQWLDLWEGITGRPEQGREPPATG
jgi:putative endonuclease